MAVADGLTATSLSSSASVINVREGETESLALQLSHELGEYEDVVLRVAVHPSSAFTVEPLRERLASHLSIKSAQLHLAGVGLGWLPPVAVAACAQQCSQRGAKSGAACSCVLLGPPCSVPCLATRTRRPSARWLVATPSNAACSDSAAAADSQ